MSKNIKIEYKDGNPDYFILKSTPELQLPSLGFKNELEAEFAVAIAKLLKGKGIDIFHELPRDITYTFRALGVINEWSEPTKNDRQD